jgi:spore coat polysaccharide biosynthesis predicted glycosyltransferase SpsG
MVGNRLAVELVRARGYAARITPTDGSWYAAVETGDLVLFDGYRFDTEDQHRARRRGARVGMVDDRGAGTHDVDVLVDPNPHTRSAYALPAGAIVLLGPEQALIRKEFLRHRRLRGGPARTLLLTFGGSDPAGLTPWALRALAGHHDFGRLVVVVGPAATFDPSEWPGVETVRSPPLPAEVFDRADAVVSAAGSTTWELLAMGLPAAVTAAVDNQVPVQQGVVERGCARGFATGDGGDDLRRVVADLTDEDVRTELSRRGRQLVDGRGAERLLDALVG